MRRSALFATTLTLGAMVAVAALASRPAARDPVPTPTPKRAVAVPKATVVRTKVVTSSRPSVRKAALAKVAATAKPAQAVAAREMPGGAGMRIERDPETGTYGPPKLGAAPIADPALNRSQEGLHEVRLPDGSYMIDLQGRFQEYTIIERGPDGKLRTRCVQDPTKVVGPEVIEVPRADR
jgi:hypothetical protein